MDVVISSDQVRRIGHNVLDKIYGPLRRFWGEIFTEVFVDSDYSPRIGYYNSILSPKGIFILKKDFHTFQSVIPLDEKEFAEVFVSWLAKNYDIKDVQRFSTAKEEQMKYRQALKPRRNPSFN
jgi:hypothetical protein